jgi:deoxyribodipyrimidine photolyase
MTKYNDLCNEFENPDHTSRLSAWLSNGCLSLRHLYHEANLVDPQSDEEITQKQMFLDTLYMKDFFKFWCIHNGKRVYREYGATNRCDSNWKDLELKDYAWNNDR